MGCGTITCSQAQSLNKMRLSYLGTLQLKLVDAHINHDLQLVGKLDPYVKFRYRNRTYTSDKCKDGGYQPKWNKEFSIKVNSLQDYVVCELWNKNLIANDDYFGEGAFYIRQKNNLDNLTIEKIVIYQNGRQNGFIRINQNLILDNEVIQQSQQFGLDYKGKIIVKPIELQFLKSLKVFTPLNLYLVIKYSDQIETTLINNVQNDKKFKFNDFVSFEKNAKDQMINIEIWNFQQDGDDNYLGTCHITALGNNNPPSNDIIKKSNIYFGQQVIGIIEFQILYEIYNYQINLNLPQSGNSEYTYQNGDKYCGEWQEGKRHGSGTCTYKLGFVYQGEWINDLWQGKGQLVYPGILTFVGIFKQGIKDGQGILKCNNNYQLEGKWVNGLIQGEGTLSMQNGKQIKIIYQDGLKVKIIDASAQSGLKENSFLLAGNYIESQNKLYHFKLGHNGNIMVINTDTKMIQYQVQNFDRMIFPPFFLKFCSNGELLAYDYSKVPYYTFGKQNGNPPFKLSIQDNGKIVISDVSKVIWQSN